MNLAVQIEPIFKILHFQRINPVIGSRNLFFWRHHQSHGCHTRIFEGTDFCLISKDCARTVFAAIEMLVKDDDEQFMLTKNQFVGEKLSPNAAVVMLVKYVDEICRWKICWMLLNRFLYVGENITIIFSSTSFTHIRTAAKFNDSQFVVLLKGLKAMGIRSYWSLFSFTSVLLRMMAKKQISILKLVCWSILM